MNFSKKSNDKSFKMMYNTNWKIILTNKRKGRYIMNKRQTIRKTAAAAFCIAAVMGAAFADMPYIAPNHIVASAESTPPAVVEVKLEDVIKAAFDAGDSYAVLADGAIKCTIFYNAQCYISIIKPGSYKITGSNYYNKSYVDTAINNDSDGDVNIECNVYINNDGFNGCDGQYKTCNLFNNNTGTTAVSGTLQVDMYNGIDFKYGTVDCTALTVTYTDGDNSNNKFPKTFFTAGTNVKLSEQFKTGVKDGGTTLLSQNYRCFSENGTPFKGGKLTKDTTVKAYESHNAEMVAAVPPTCTTDGTIEHWICSHCGEKFEDKDCTTPVTDVTVPAKHTLTHHEAKNPTCTEAGNVEYWDCSACGLKFSDENGTKEITAPVSIDAAGHSFGEWETVTKPTAEKDGEQKRTCSKCGFEETKPISVLHSADTSKWLTDENSHWHACATPDCTEIFDKADHTPDEGTVTVKATYKSKGVKTFSCSVCGTELYTEEIPVIDLSDPNVAAEVFVDRLYEELLGRPGDEAGKQTHIDNLLKKAPSLKAYYDFIFSEEFTNLDISLDEKLTRICRIFLDREPTAEEMNRWKDALENGCSIGYVFADLANSDEFIALCELFHLEPGTWKPTENRDINPNLTKFISRMYNNVLGRRYDVDGINNHAGKYLELGDLYAMAFDFLFSPEFIEKNTTDEEFVEILYSTFFDREPDTKGRNDWLESLADGKSREEVLAGFVYSDECKELVESFDID